MVLLLCHLPHFSNVWRENLYSNQKLDEIVPVFSLFYYSMIKIFRGTNYPFVVAKLMYKYVVVVSCVYKNCVTSRQHDLLGQSRQMLSVFVCLVGWLFLLSFISSYLYCRVNARFLKRRPIFLYRGYQRFFLACVGELRFVGRRPTRVRPKAEDTSGEAARKNARVTF